MIGFIEHNRAHFGVEPICRLLPIAPSTYYAHNAVARNPGLACDRAKRDIVDREKIKAVYDDSTGRYGARKVWRQLVRDGHRIARCTVENHGLTGRCAWQEGNNDSTRYGTPLPGRQGQPPIRGEQTESIVGV